MSWLSWIRRGTKEAPKDTMQMAGKNMAADGVTEAASKSTGPGISAGGRPPGLIQKVLGEYADQRALNKAKQEVWDTALKASKETRSESRPWLFGKPTAQPMQLQASGKEAMKELIKSEDFKSKVGHLSADKFDKIFSDSRLNGWASWAANRAENGSLSYRFGTSALSATTVGPFKFAWKHPVAATALAGGAAAAGTAYAYSDQIGNALTGAKNTVNALDTAAGRSVDLNAIRASGIDIVQQFSDAASTHGALGVVNTAMNLGLPAAWDGMQGAATASAPVANVALNGASQIFNMSSGMLKHAGMDPTIATVLVGFAAFMVLKNAIGYGTDKLPVVGGTGIMGLAVTLGSLALAFKIANNATENPLAPAPVQAGFLPRPNTLAYAPT